MRSLTFAIIGSLASIVQSQTIHVTTASAPRALAVTSSTTAAASTISIIISSASSSTFTVVVSEGPSFSSAISIIIASASTSTFNRVTTEGSSFSSTIGFTTSSATRAATPLPLSSPATTLTISSTSASPSSSSSSSSPTTTPTEVTSNGGLTDGAKAGIGVGVGLVVIIAILVALFCFRRQKKQSVQREKQDVETADALAAQRGHEMITSANTHEMDAKRAADFQEEDLKPDTPEGFQELETQNSPPVHSMIRAEDPAEMEAPYNIQSTNVGSDWEYFQPSELDASTSAAQRAELHSTHVVPESTSRVPQTAPISVAGTSQSGGRRSLEQGYPSAPAASSSTPRSPEDKLEVLRKRMERVREDKERLEKIQALKDLEAELQAEILAEQKKASGTRNNSRMEGT